MNGYIVSFYDIMNGRKYIGGTTVEAEHACAAISIATAKLKMDCRLFQYQELEIKIERLWT